MSGYTAPMPETDGVQPELHAQILIVDDEVDHAEVMSEALRRLGHVCTIVDGATAAEEELRFGGFDVIVTDLSMPDMSGRELAAAIRQRFPGLPVLLLTGDTDAEADGADVAAVVKKPFQLDVLDAAVRAVAEG